MGLMYSTEKDLGMLGTVSCIAMSRPTGPQAEAFKSSWNLLGAIGHNTVSDSSVLTFEFPAENLSGVGRELGVTLTRPDFDDASLKPLMLGVAQQIYNNPYLLHAPFSSTIARQLYGRGLVGATIDERFQALRGITFDGLCDYWAAHVIPAGSSIAYVGPLGPDEVLQGLAGLGASWTSTRVAPVRTVDQPVPASATRILLHNRPRSVQCTLEIAQSGVTFMDPDWVAFAAATDILGGAGLTSRATNRLREELGYTYECAAVAVGSASIPVFTFKATVETSNAVSALGESMKLVRGILDGPTEDELALVKNANARKSVSRYDSLDSCTDRLVTRLMNGWPDDLEERWDDQVSRLTVDQVRDAVRRHLDPDHMIIVVDGDAPKLREGLVHLGLGEVIDIDGYGNEIEKPKDAPKADK
jgi:predicted Zn-dependent peptidase